MRAAKADQIEELAHKVINNEVSSKPLVPGERADTDRDLMKTNIVLPETEEMKEDGHHQVEQPNEEPGPVAPKFTPNMHKTFKEDANKQKGLDFQEEDAHKGGLDFVTRQKFKSEARLKHLDDFDDVIDDVAAPNTMTPAKAKRL